MSARRLERRSGFRLAPEIHIEDALKVRQMGERLQPGVPGFGTGGRGGRPVAPAICAAVGLWIPGSIYR